MVIAKMNSVLLKHSRIMFGLFTAIIIISFVWFFTPGASGNILFGTNPMSPNAVVGSVFDREITRGELMEMIKDNMLVMAANYGVSPVMNGLDDQALEEAFQKAVLLSVAKQMGVTVSVERVGEYLRSLPAFAGTDGKFSLEKYQKYEKEMLQPLGYNALDLDRAVRNLLTIFSLGNSAVNEVIVTENEIADFERTVLERCTVKTILFPFAAAKKELKPTEAELQNFHKANPKLFMTEPQYRVKVVRFNYADYADKVKLAPDAARKYYDANKAEFTKDGKTTPFASVEKTIKAKLQKNEMVKSENQKLYESLVNAYPKTYECTQHVREYLKDILIIDDNTKLFYDKFQQGTFKPELLFDDKEIIERIKKHPMIMWKLNNK